jgi:Rrf2 family iron-sulfur cluster assembly transcriptional regulator
MKLSAKGRYAIKALVNIATNDSKTPKTLLEISKYQGISLSYLEQLFSLLRKHDLVSGVRGPGGGYRLKDSPDNITIASIIQAINPEGSKEMNNDKTDDVVWDKFSKKLTNYLDTVTLGSLINETKTSNNDLDLDKAKTNDNDIDLEELTNYYQQN